MIGFVGKNKGLSSPSPPLLSLGVYPSLPTPPVPSLPTPPLTFEFPDNGL